MSISWKAWPAMAVVLALWLQPGCREGAAQTPTADEPVAGTEVPGTFLPDALKRVAAYLPGDAWMLLSVDAAEMEKQGEALMWDGLPEALLKLQAEDRKAQLAFLERASGLKLESLRSMHFIFFDKESFALILEGEMALGDDSGQYVEAIDIGGTRVHHYKGEPEIFIVPLADVGSAWLFTKEDLDLYMAAAAPAGPGLSEEKVAELADSFGAMPGAWAAGLFRFDLPEMAEGWTKETELPAPQELLFHMAGKNLRFAMRGKPECLDGVLAFVADVRTKVRKLLDEDFEDFRNVNPGLGLLVVTSDELFDPVFDGLTPTRKGDELTLEFQFPSLITFATLGIVSSIAIPAFIKYNRKSKTSEAIDNLESLFKGASDFYCTPRVEKGTGKLVPPHFPPSVGPTPAIGACCNLGTGDAENRCLANPEWWTVESWSALHFQVNEPHYFSYELKTRELPEGGHELEISAYADLDCDGTPSTFRRWAKGQGTGMDCQVTSEAALFTQNETE